MMNEQMEMDLRLEYEKSLKDNVQKMAEFAEIQIKEEERPKAIESQHEAFGVLCSKQAQIGLPAKAAARNIQDMLNLIDEGDIRDVTGSLYNSCVDIAVKAIVTAAHCRRALNDLYSSYSAPKSPIEEAIDAAEDGFDEAAEEGGTEEPAVSAQEADPAPEMPEPEDSTPEPESAWDGAQRKLRDLREAALQDEQKPKRRGRRKAGADE